MTRQKPILAPSILSADFSRLKDQISAVEEGGAQWLHLDLMDGQFVPNLTFGPVIIQSVAKCTSLFLDAHLMVQQPEMYFEDLAKSGVAGITIHQEAVTHLDAAVNRIKALGCKAGVSINPSTPVDVLDTILPELDLVLIMSVNPGFGGQSYIPYCTEKIKVVREMLDLIDKPITLQIDGGVKVDNVKQVIEAGADNVVAGSAVFNGDPAGSCRAFLEQMAP